MSTVQTDEYKTLRETVGSPKAMKEAYPIRPLNNSKQQDSMYRFAARTGKGSVAVERTEYSAEYRAKLNAIFED